VFNNPVKILQWILPLNFRTQRVLFSSVPICTMSQCPPGRVSILSCSRMHLLNAHLEELSESSVILVLLELTGEFLSMYHRALVQCPPGRASQNSSELLSSSELHRVPSVHFFSLAQCPPGRAYRTPPRFCLQLCFLIHSLASKVFNNLEVFLLNC
jgi:hypothetical protein